MDDDHHLPSDLLQSWAERVVRTVTQHAPEPVSVWLTSVGAAAVLHIQTVQSGVRIEQRRSVLAGVWYRQQATLPAVVEALDAAGEKLLKQMTLEWRTWMAEQVTQDDEEVPEALPVRTKCPARVPLLPTESDGDYLPRRPRKYAVSPEVLANFTRVRIALVE